MNSQESCCWKPSNCDMCLSTAALNAVGEKELCQIAFTRSRRSRSPNCCATTPPEPMKLVLLSSVR